MNAPRSYQRSTIALQSIVPDLIPQDAPGDAWNTGNNVVFRNGETVRALGDKPTLPGAQTGAKTLTYARTISGQGFWVYATETGIYAHDGSIEYDITPAGGWAPGTFQVPAESQLANVAWTSGAMNGFVWINASDRDPVWWDLSPSNPCQPLPDWPTNGRCVALRAHKNFLFAIGFLSEGAQRVRWSDAAEAGQVPTSWTPAADNLAGFIDIAPLSSPAIDGVTLRDSFLIYKNESIWAFDFIGGQFVFNARKLFAEHGVAGVNAITRGLDDVHLFVGDEGDIFLTDGVTVKSVLDGRAQRTFYRDFAQNPDRVFNAMTLSREKLAYVIFPSGAATTGTRALLFDFASGSISFRDMPGVMCSGEGGALEDVGQINTWDGDGGAWAEDASSWGQEAFGQTLDDVLIGGDFGFAIVSADDSPEFVTGPIEARVSKSGISFGAPQSRKVINRVWPKVRGVEGDTLVFRFGGQEVTDGPIRLSPPITFTIGQDAPIDLFISGRFLSIDVSSLGGNVWRLGSMDLEYQEVGAW